MFLDIPPSSLLKTRPRSGVSLAEISRLQQSFERLEIAPSNVTTSLNLSPPTSAVESTLPRETFLTLSTAITSKEGSLPANLAKCIIYNQELSSSLAATPALMPLNLFAFERAIVNICPVLERSAAIAGIATAMPEPLIPIVNSAVPVSAVSFIKNKEKIGAPIAPTPSVESVNLCSSSSAWGNVLKVFAIFVAVEVAIVGLVLVELIVEYQAIQDQIVARGSLEWSQPC
jgi:hypothetical protein